VAPFSYSRSLLASRAASVKASAKRSNVLPSPKKVAVADKIEWQEPLTIIKYPDPRLRAVNARVGVFNEDLKRLSHEMLKVMYEDDGVGLAAPQVGVNIRLMVFNETAKPGDPAEKVLVNPTILAKSKTTDMDIEGCLSFPDMYQKIERHLKIEVRYQDLEGEEHEMVLTDFPARVFQHEYDHLQGILFHDRMKPGELEKARAQLVELEQTYITAHPEAQVQLVPPPAPPKPAKRGFGFGKR